VFVRIAHLYVPGVTDWAEFEIRKLGGVLACAVGDRGVVILLGPSANAAAVSAAARSIAAAAGLRLPVQVMGGATSPTATLVSAAARRPALSAAAAGIAVLALASSVAALTGRLPFTSGPPSQPAIRAAAPAPRRGGPSQPPAPFAGVIPGPPTLSPPPLPAPAATVSLALAVVHPSAGPPRPLVVTLVPVAPPPPVPALPQTPLLAPGKPLTVPPNPPSKPQVLAPKRSPQPGEEPATKSDCSEADDRAEADGQEADSVDAEQECVADDEPGEHGDEPAEDRGAGQKKVQGQDDASRRISVREE
jgi:hypothetical protein